MAHRRRGSRPVPWCWSWGWLGRLALRVPPIPSLLSILTILRGLVPPSIN